VFPTKSGHFSLEGTKPIRCVIADDHTLLRDGVRRLLEDAPDFAVVGEAGDASEALKQVIEHRPDIILLDISMPGMSSFEAARLIETSLEATILQKFVTYDFERLLPGSTKVKTSEFAQHMVDNMVDRRKKTAV